MKSYLITGGAGFIGSHLTDTLLDRGDRVVVLDDFSSGHASNLRESDPHCTILRGNVLHLASDDARIGDVDAVIHLAALISGHDSLVTPDEYVNTNIRGLLRVIEFAKNRRIPRIIFASSSTVYGNSNADSLTEATLPAPTSVYALSKLAGEHLLQMYSTLHGFTHCSLRLFNVYGPRQNTDHPYANVTCKFSHAAANGLPINRYGDGEQSRDFVYVADVVQAFLAVLAESNHTLYNVGTGAEHKINDLIAKLEAIVGKELGVTTHPFWPNDIRRIRSDMSLFKQEFGFVPRTSLDTGLASTVDYFRHLERT